MMVFDCEGVRDLLPSLVRGEMLPHEATPVERHLKSCATCRDEAEIVRLLQDAFVPLPAGLEERVVGAVRRRATQRWTPARLALAATFAAAVVGGSLIFGRLSGGPEAGNALDVSALTWAAAEDPLLHGSTELQELSADELEALLTELDR